MEYLERLFDVFVHLDVHVNELATVLGPWLYLLLFAIVFCETGLVVTPFLPGDSLLFATGAVAATHGSQLSLGVLAVILLVAAVAGDSVNYLAGWYVGPRVFKSEQSRLFNRKHLMRTQHFYERYGGKTIILARFMPIIRTFAPFVAGIGRMEYRRFSVYNITGAIAWVLAFLLMGYYFGSMQTVQRNFHIVVLAIVVLSILPAIIEFALTRRHSVLAASQVDVPDDETKAATSSASPPRVHLGSPNRLSPLESPD